MSPAEAIERLRSRLDSALTWYEGCVVCDETLRNVQRDVDSVWREARAEFPKTFQDYRIRVAFEGTEFVARVEKFEYMKAAS